ncbi:MAG: hypothetical protein HY897_20700 [Deltaproteobacteria bacterium]|nr:hypothetical protein [Deltaproteobacteria bacterium]
MEIVRLIAVPSVVVAAAASAAWGGGSGVPHVKLPADSPVPISGWPFYIENLTTGSPLSDYGSHHGIKASVLDYVDRSGTLVIPKETFGYMAHYAARSDAQRKWDKFFIGIVDDDSGAAPSPVTDRRIALAPFGWEETARYGEVSLLLRAVTWSQDVFVFSVEATQGSAEGFSVSPLLHFVADDEVTREAMVSVSTGGDTCALSVAAGEGVIACEGSRSLVRIVRAFPPVAAAYDTGVPRSYAFRLGAISVPAGSSNGFSFAIAFGKDEAEARAAFDASGIEPSPDPSALEGAWVNKAREWDGFFKALPPPHTDDPETARLYRMAATGLRHNVYGKRNAMPADCSVPGKVHFNYFFGWDAPLHALGHREWDPVLAAGDLSVVFGAQQDDNRIPYMTDDKLAPLGAPESTQPPVQGWVAGEIARASGYANLEWVSATYEAGADYLRFFERGRDTDGDGLFEYRSGFETGWDDTPRFHCKGTSNLCLDEVTTIDALDLNAWLHLFYEWMAEAATALGESREATRWKEKAGTLAEDIEQKMWDAESGAYYDIERDDAGNHSFIRVRSPVILWPLFAGITTDPARAESVIKNHLLDPDAFWGLGKDGARFSVPSIAYGDSAYDSAQDGYYWQGQVWLLPSYAALVALSRYGYAKEAEELKGALVSMILQANPGGIHETYDAQNGEVGWGSGTGDTQKGGVGEPSVFQFGWSTAFVMEMLLDRHQSSRYLRADEASFAGYVREAAFIPSREVFYRIETGGASVPLVEIAAADGGPLASASKLTARFSDPYVNLSGTVSVANLPMLLVSEWAVQSVDANGTATAVAPDPAKEHVSFVPVLDSGVDHYAITRRVVLEGKPKDESSGCSCSVLNSGL